MQYNIHQTSKSFGLDVPWNSREWQSAEEGQISCYLKESTFTPDVRFRLLYDAAGIYGIFRVKDKYIRSIRMNDLEPVYLDSCVEFFVKPSAGRGYLNFEFNCGGVLNAKHILDHERVGNSCKEFHTLGHDQLSVINRFSTLPRINDPERVGSRIWYLSFFIPFTIFQEEFGMNAPVQGDVWHGNFYKCGGETSHPHWGMWSPIPKRNFHLPEYFSPLYFS